MNLGTSIECRLFRVQPYPVISAISMVGLKSVLLKVADVASVADEERRSESHRMSVSTGGEPILKSKGIRIN